MYHTKEKILQKKFISLLKEKIPGHLVNTLMEILPLTKEAIYRRLRGDVSFSFVEMAALSEHLGISLDNVANTMPLYRTQWFQLHVRDYNEFKPIDLNMSHNYIKTINMAANSPNSEYGIAANMIPLHISLLHPLIYRVYILKWRYQCGITPKSELSYSNMQIPKEEQETYSLFLKAVKRIKNTFFIWDNSFLTSLINDISYFHKIQKISREEMHMIKQEMRGLLDTLEYYVDNESLERNGNKVETYVSSLNIENSYTYLHSDDFTIGMCNAYSLGAFTSLEKKACDEMIKWVQGIKNSSTLISGAAQRDKIIFFEKQRNILEQNFIVK